MVVAQRAGLSATMKGTIPGTERYGDVTIHALDMRPIIVDFASMTPLNTVVHARELTDGGGRKRKERSLDILLHMRS